jgi:hypothetical protein
MAEKMKNGTDAEHGAELCADAVQNYLQMFVQKNGTDAGEFADQCRQCGKNATARLSLYPFDTIMAL